MYKMNNKRAYNNKIEIICTIKMNTIRTNAKNNMVKYNIKLEFPPELTDSQLEM